MPAIPFLWDQPSRSGFVEVWLLAATVSVLEWSSMNVQHLHLQQPYLVLSVADADPDCSHADAGTENTGRPVRY